MAKNKNKDIEIRYRKVSRDNSIQQSSKEDTLARQELRNQILQNYWKWLRACAIVIAIISVFILISILSFSPLDEFVSDFSLKDYFDAFLGKEYAITKLQQVSNLLGSVGAMISNFFVNKTIGYFSVVFPILILVWSVKILVTRSLLGRLINWTIVLLLLSFCLSAFVGSLNLLFNISIPFYWIGSVGVFLSNVAGNFLGRFGSFFLYLASLFLIVIFAFDVKIEQFFLSFIDFLKSKFNKKSIDENQIEIHKSQQDEIKLDGSENIQNQLVEADDLETVQILIKSFKEESLTSHSSVDEHTYGDTSESKEDLPLDQIEPKQEEEFQPNQETPKLIVTVEENEEEEEKQQNEATNNAFTPISTLNLDEKINYTPPPIDLLIDDESKFQINEEELKQNARLLQEKLETFKIYIENLTVIPGPVVTQYEFVPAPGIKISRIQSLADDIALGLKAKGIRIIAPVPGKGTVGIEIPNKKPLV
ncbi:MAG: DNA translocase FtsK 4TM domain-containing protein, partial [Candidatus Kapaibacteriota bacterium]